MEEDAPVLAADALDADGEGMYLVAIIGGKDVGKSALVNALVGQEITAVVNPAANGAPTAIVVKVILADGSEIMSRERGQNPVD